VPKGLLGRGGPKGKKSGNKRPEFLEKGHWSSRLRQRRPQGEPSVQQIKHRPGVWVQGRGFAKTMEKVTRKKPEGVCERKKKVTGLDGIVNKKWKGTFGEVRGDQKVERGGKAEIKQQLSSPGYQKNPGTSPSISGQGSKTR